MNGQEEILRQRAVHGARPCIHPLRPVDGVGVLTEDAPAHHPWQHGLYTGFHGVGGSDFWIEQGEGVGRIESRRPEADPEGGPAAWIQRAAWRGCHGQLLVAETQRWSAAIDAGLLVLDLDWTLAVDAALHIERHAYGGLFLRMPFRAERGAAVIDSEGRRDDACEQQRARWLSLWMPIDERADGGGVAILDHPGNAADPVAWRVDGHRGVGPSPCIGGPIDLDPASPRSWRYRIIAHGGRLDPAIIEERWQEYAS